MRWAPPLFAAAFCFGLGVVSSPYSRPGVAMPGSEQPAVLGWLASRGMHPVAALRLDPASDRPVWLVSDGGRCEAAVAPLESGAAIAVVRQQLGPTAWDSTRIWAGSLQGWPDSPVVLAWRRFVRWSKGQPAPDSALLAGPAHCLDALARPPGAAPQG